MDCNELRNRFEQGKMPSGPEVQAHLDDCPACSALLSGGTRLGRVLSDATSPLPGELPPMEALERALAREVGLRARARALGRGAKLAAMAGAGLVLFAGQILLGPRSDLSSVAAAPFVLFALVLVLGLLVGSHRLAEGLTRPLVSPSRQMLEAALLLLLPALAVAFAPREAEEAWGTPLKCFAYGAALSLPLAGLILLLERRDLVPPLVTAIGGAVAGIAANLLLHAHCASSHAGHLLLGHATLGAIWALLLTALFSTRRGRALAAG